MKTNQTRGEPNGSALIGRTIAEKSLFSREAIRTQRKLRRRIEKLEEALRHSIALGQLHPSDRLIRARESLRVNFSVARDLLVDLRKSDIDQWETSRIALEEALENLNRSVSAFISKFDDERRHAAGKEPFTDLIATPDRPLGERS